ncbi:MAG: serine hydrolase [Pseudoflavonifractor sp.]
MGRMSREAALVLALVLAATGILTGYQAAELAEPSATPIPLAAETKAPGLTLEEIRTLRFSDVPEDAEYRDAVSYAAYRGILTGCGDGTFDPYAPVTRATAVTVLWRMSGEAGGRATFPDVPTEAWYAAAGAWGAETEIVTGNPDGSFAPEGLVSRGDLSCFLYRYAQHMGYDIACTVPLTGYPDNAAVAEYAQIPLAWAVQNGIYGGFAVDGSLHPDRPVSRCQLAGVLVRLLSHGTYEPLAHTLALQKPRPTESKSLAHHDRLQEAVNGAAKKYGAAGVQVAVIEDGRVTDTYTWGQADAGVPMTADHKLRVASISKVVIGMSAMLLQEDGVVDLDAAIGTCPQVCADGSAALSGDDPGTYWGTPVYNPYYPQVPITIRNLLSHTSSIIIAGDGTSHNHDAAAALLRSKAGYRRVAPGDLAGWGYNNYGFAVLGMTLELAAHQTMDGVLNDHLFRTMDIDAAFEPGNLKNTDLLATIYENGTRVTRSIATQKTLCGSPVPGANGSFFAGGLTISAADLGKLIALLANDGVYQDLALMTPASVQTMETKSAAKVSTGFYQALPLCYRENIYGRDGLYYHTGSAYGVYNCASYDPATGDGVVVLTTGASGAKDQNSIYAICGAISDAVYAVTK